MVRKEKRFAPNDSRANYCTFCAAKSVSCNTFIMVSPHERTTIKYEKCAILDNVYCAHYKCDGGYESLEVL